MNYPFLKDVSVAEFRYGSTKLFWKVKHGGEYNSGKFIRKKHRENAKLDIGIQSKGASRGVTASKLKDILEKPGLIIPKHKISFWESLPTNEYSNDLTVNYDHLAELEQENAEKNNRNQRKNIK